MKYKKKPVIIEAFRWGYDERPQWMWDIITSVTKATERKATVCYDKVYIKTLKGEMVANKGDYIIKGIKNEIYPCKANIFEATYEKID